MSAYSKVGHDYTDKNGLYTAEFLDFLYTQYIIILKLLILGFLSFPSLASRLASEEVDVDNWLDNEESWTAS